MRQSLPKQTKITDEAKETVNECATEFIHLITSEACEIAANDKRRVIRGDDLLQALYNMGFDRYLENLELLQEKVMVLKKDEIHK